MAAAADAAVLKCKYDIIPVQFPVVPSPQIFCRARISRIGCLVSTVWGDSENRWVVGRFLESPRHHPTTTTGGGAILRIAPPPGDSQNRPKNKNNHDNQQQRYSKAHTDIGCLTILYQDDVGGLQIRRKEGEWINTKPLPGSFVVNIVDCLQMWSNGRYRSAEHRVVYGGSERFSMVFFLDFTDKAEIRAPEELIDEKHPRKYKGVTFEDLKAYFMKAGPTLGGPPAYFLLETEGI